MKRFTGVLLLVLTVAVPAFGRVVSYAPYTDRVALPSYQDRTSRHFALIEAKAEDFLFPVGREVVLYDSTGAEEPRAITPKPGVVWWQTALYQKRGGAPVILALGTNQAMVSEGGTVWRKVEGLGPSFSPDAVLDVDTGGPFANGLFAPVLLGNEEWPFVVTLFGGGVWAVDRNGNTKQLSNALNARAIGRNAAGDRFLIRANNTLSTATLDGTLTKIADLPEAGSYAGWITSGGIAYVELLRSNGRTLYRTGGTSLQLVASAPPAAAKESNTPVPLRLFAVPTHDYEGAWIVQRGPNAPTTLSRHTPASGLQTMWIDETGPQVEALIAGASGKTLLVQVHREREGAVLAQPFLDPALAVWWIGQPAPRAYDELYLNESWNKGFVVVDADAIEGGRPFVFNSGFKEIAAPVSRVSAPISGGGDVVQEWGVVRGSLKQRLVLPGVARLRGAYLSFWQTDLTVYNPLEEEQEVEVRFVPLGLPSAVTATLTLAPHEIRTVPDALKSLFFIDEGGGTLHLLPAAGVNATARTYSRRPDGGTFGFGMQAIDFFNAIGPRFAATFAGAFPGENFRTNLLLTDTSGRGTSATLSGSGVETPVLGSVQVSAVPAATALRADGGGALVVEPARGTAIATVVAIDNRTNDPTWFPPDLPGSVPRSIPVVGHLDGANGGRFRSDLYLYNPRNTTRVVAMTATNWDTGARGFAYLTLFPGESRVIPDVLKSLFGMGGVARLRYASPDGQTGDTVRVTSRTYSVDANGGTYGCLVPPLNPFQIATAGDRLEILGISGGPGFRTNVGLVDLSDTSQSRPLVRLTIVDERHRTLDTWTVEIPARGGLQLTDVFRTRGIPSPSAALLVVEVLDGRQIGAYATLTDNVTNDSTYLGANLGAQPEAP